MCAIPFGFAVVPDVYIRKSRSSLSIGSGGHVAGSSETSKSCSQWSRPSCIGTSLPVRRTTSAFRIPGASAIAVVGGALQRHGRAAAPRLVLRDQHLAAHVVRAVGERVGGEAAEDDRVRRAEPGAGEHRHRQLGDHPHVDRDLRALADAELLERVRDADDVALEVGVA